MIPIYISQISFVNSGAAVVYFFELLCTVSEAPDSCHSREGIAFYIVIKCERLS